MGRRLRLQTQINGAAAGSVSKADGTAHVL
jgi:hypothetical protein